MARLTLVPFRTRRFSMVSFAVGADAYDRFMGRYSAPLAPLFADFAGVSDGQCALDVGCGPGALTAELVKRLGSAAVAAVDPSDSFVTAARQRHRMINVRKASAEQLPFEDSAFDVTLAQLVVHFLPEPLVGLREMARVTRPNGAVAACVWDHHGGTGPLSLFWAAAREIDPDVETESQLPGARQGHLTLLFDEAGLQAIEETALSVAVEHQTFEDWWEPFLLGVGPAGRYVAELDLAWAGGASRPMPGLVADGALHAHRTSLGRPRRCPLIARRAGECRTADLAQRRGRDSLGDTLLRGDGRAPQASLAPCADTARAHHCIESGRTRGGAADNNAGPQGARAIPRAVQCSVDL